MASSKPNPFHKLPAPNPVKLNDHYILGEIIDNIAELYDDLHKEYPSIDLDIIRSQLIDVRSENVKPKEHLRSFLRAYQRTREYRTAYAQLDDTTKSQIDTFIAGKPEGQLLSQNAAGHSVFHLPPSPAVKHHFRELFDGLFDRHGERRLERQNLPVIYENVEETMIMEVYSDKEFQNWGQSVLNTPKYTFVPKKVLGLQNLVKYAKENNLRVRVGGYRHSWGQLFSQDNHILVSLLNLQEVTTLPDPLPIGADVIDPENELKNIELASGAAADGKTSLVRVGVSVTSEQFRRWAVANGNWTIPMDTVLVEVTTGGVNGPICHGAGRRHKTLSDQVRAIEYVDVNGDRRTVSDPAQLLAAGGCFGLLGIVTHVTLEVNKMTYALMRPSKPDITLAIPPLEQSDVPLALQKTYTATRIAAAQADFESRVANDYYSEWFWFPYQKKALVNTWSDTPDQAGTVDYPDAFETWFQWVQGWLGGVITSSKFFNDMPGRWQAQIMATLSMMFLPPAISEDVKTIKTLIPNALHFRRGTQNMRVRDMEYQIPIPYLPSEGGAPPKPDFGVIQRAWWDVINLVYEDSESPMRLTLEMRVMGGSNMIMAPQRGNEWGTASIEILTLPDAVSDGEWMGFCQAVSDKWMSYTDAENRPLNVRPHWAKEWDGVNMRGLPARKYLKTEAYKDAIPEFKAVLASIGQGQGWGLDDLRARFSNELWDEMIFSA